MSTFLIKEVTLVNEGQEQVTDVLIKGQRIEKIGRTLTVDGAYTEIDGAGLHLLAGVIDDQVHFREPGLTHKATIYSESRAAVAGGVTSFMEMPNTNPPAFTQELLSDKYATAAQTALANYSFYMGTSNDNIDEVLKTDQENVCGVKIFMGSSTGNLLVDKPAVLEGVFSRCPMLIATHCESEALIHANLAKAVATFSEDIPVGQHPIIRDEEVCYASSSQAIALAKKYGTRLHVLHISTAEEVALFDNTTPRTQKKITSEACVHHLWFDASDYDRLGAKIKCNPAIKDARHKGPILQGLIDNHIDVIATDHAPHLLEEKAQIYAKSPSGLPLIQRTLQVMLEFVHQGKVSLPWVVDKMSHAVADLYQMVDRGYLREGYYADAVLVNLNQPILAQDSDVLYKCGWDPFAGVTFQSQVLKTFVSGHLAYDGGKINNSQLGMRLKFQRRA